MKNKRINKIVATTILTVILVTPLATTVNAFDGSQNVPTQNTVTLDESMPPGTEITISDREVYETARSLGYDVNMSVLNQRAKNGVNKIVWRSNGGFDLYVSKNTLLLGTGAAIAALTVLFAPFAPATISVISGAIGMYAGGNISSGRVFRFNKSMIGKYDYKYTYLKSWAQ